MTITGDFIYSFNETVIDESEKKKQAGSVLKQLLTVIENMWNDLDHRRKDFERMDQRTNTCG